MHRHRQHRLRGPQRDAECSRPYHRRPRGQSRFPAAHPLRDALGTWRADAYRLSLRSLRLCAAPTARAELPCPNPAMAPVITTPTAPLLLRCLPRRLSLLCSRHRSGAWLRAAAGPHPLYNSCTPAYLCTLCTPMLHLHLPALLRVCKPILCCCSTLWRIPSSCAPSTCLSSATCRASRARSVRGSPKPHIPRPTPHILRPKPLVSEWTGELVSADSPVRTRQRRLTRARATQTVWATRISTHSAASGPACRRSGWLGPSARGSGRSSCTACSAT